MKKSPVSGPERSNRSALLLAAFSAGFVSLLAQMVFLREFLTVFYGTELSISIILGFWLLWTGCGSALASLLIRKKDTAFALRGYIFVTLAIAFVILAELILIREVRTVLSVPAGELLSIKHLVYSVGLILFPVCTLVGAQYVFIVNAQLISLPAFQGHHLMGKIYSFECVGSSFAGAVMSFVLVPLFSSLTILLIGAFISVTSCAVFAGRSRPVFALLLFIVLSWFLFSSDAEKYSQMRFWKGFNEDLRYVEGRNSPYGNLSVCEYGGDYTIYASGHKLYSLPDRGEHAPFVNLIMLQTGEGSDILLVGGGISGGLKDILRHNPASVDYLEQDGAAAELLLRYASDADRAAFGDRRVRYYRGDGRSFIRETSRLYDLVIVNAGEPVTAAANRFYTIEFFEEVRAKLKRNGIFALGPLVSGQLHSDYSMLARNRIIFHTLKKVFAAVAATAGDPMLFLCSGKNDLIKLRGDDLYQTLQERGIHNVDIYGLIEEFYLKKARFELEYGVRYNPVLQGGLPPDPLPVKINSDLHPLVYYGSIMMWPALSGFGGEHFRVLGNISIAHLLLLAVLFCSLLLAALKFTTARQAAMVSILASCFVTGFFGICTTLIIIHMFQSAYGYMYQYIGFVFSLMLMGTAIGSRVFINRRASKVALLFLLACCSVFAVLLPFLMATGGLLRGIIQLLLFSFSALISGVLTGAGFSVNAGMYARIRGSGAGLVYSFDLLGGCLGAFVVMAVLLPVTGLQSVSIFLSALCLGALFVNSGTHT